jgi:hypothetical protein
MGRILYVVAREHPLLCGYLRAKVDAQSPDRHSVEIKLDERRGERRRKSNERTPERRRREQRRQPSLEGELRSRGYASVLQHEDGQSRTDLPGAGPALSWRPRSTPGQRAARAWRRYGVRWALRAGVFIAALGLSILVARSIHRPANSSGTMVPRVTEESSLPSAAPIRPDSPPLHPMPPPPTPPSPQAPPQRTPAYPTRASGVVLSVDLKATALVLQDMGALPGGRRLRIRLAPDTRIVLSERASHTVGFKDTAIGLSEIRSGDFVVVDMSWSDRTPLARSVVVTFRAGQGTGEPTRPAN